MEKVILELGMKAQGTMQGGILGLLWAMHYEMHQMIRWECQPSSTRHLGLGSSTPLFTWIVVVPNLCYCFFLDILANKMKGRDCIYKEAMARPYITIAATNSEGQTTICVRLVRSQTTISSN